MPYIGKSPLHGNYSKLDSVSGSFDGSTTQFALTTNSIAVTPVTASAVIISINGVLQEPTTAYTVSGTNITFTSAPASTDTFFGVVMGEQLAIGTPSDASVTSAKLSGNLVTPGTLDLNGQELILDANANTSITADTDDQIDFKISGADDFRMTANNFNVLSGSTLTIDSGATITNSGTASGFGSNVPTSADGQALGSASAEWSDLYLADGGVIYFGNDQDVTVTHDPDDGLFLKSKATAYDNPFLLTLQTGETDLAADDVIGKIAFQAPDEGTGTDAILVSAAIQARAEGNHSSSSNASSLDFMLGASEAAATKMTLNSTGNLSVGDGTAALPSYANVGDLNTGVYFPAADTVGVTAGGTEQFRFGSNPIPGGGGKNLLINGNMAVAQRGTQTAQGDTSKYSACDRWYALANGSPQARVTTTQTADTNMNLNGFEYTLKVDCTTAEGAVGAAENFVIQQKIEAQNLQGLKYGTANAEEVTLSFWMSSPKTGTHCVGLYLSDTGYAQVKEFTIASADTWEYFALTFSANTSNKINNDIGSGMIVSFPFTAGTDFHTSAGSWTSGGDFATSNQQNLLDNTANNVSLTGIQLEIGSVATSFAYEDYSTTLMKCYRYLEIIGPQSTGNGYTRIGSGFIATATVIYFDMFFHPKRAVPTIASSGTAYANAASGSGTIGTGAITSDQLGPQSAMCTLPGGSSMTLGRGVSVALYNNGISFVTIDAEL